MKQRLFLGLMVLALIVAACSSPPSDVSQASTGEVVDEGRAARQEFADATSVAPIDAAQSSFEFEGYGVGKSHIGTFTQMSGSLTRTDGRITGASGVIDAGSLATGIDKLDAHLKSADFFDVEKYPQIVFTSTSVTDDAMVGTLQFHGVTREITIPLEERGKRLVAEFRLNIKDFGVSYAGVNEEARIKFSLSD